MSLIKSINEMALKTTLSPDHMDIVNQLATYWKARLNDMTDDELREAVALDMENIPGVEGDPDLINQLVPIVISTIRGE